MAERLGLGTLMALRALAISWLLVAVSLVVWSLAPVAVGWKPQLILTGSMLPKIKPGDVVLTEPGRMPRVGQVALLRDPYAPTKRVLHRVVKLQDDGTFISQGDNNPSPDSTVHSSDDVQGLGRLVVPGAGRVALVMSGRGSPADRLWTLLTIASLAIYAGTRRYVID